VPAGSTWGGSEGDEWAESPQEKPRLGSQQAMRGATRSEHRAGLENEAAEADTPQPWGRPPSQEKGRETHPAVPPGYWVAARMGQIVPVKREWGRLLGSESRIRTHPGETARGTNRQGNDWPIRIILS